MAKKAKTKPEAPGKPSACSGLARDLQSMGTTMADLHRGYPSGNTFGPRHNRRYIDVRQSPGPQGTYVRCFMDAETYKVKSGCSSVGNEYGVARQLGRDIARLWGCKTLQPERGFEGAGPSKRKR
jgi:hypothetical protein